MKAIATLENQNIIIKEFNSLLITGVYKKEKKKVFIVLDSNIETSKPFHVRAVFSNINDAVGYINDCNSSNLHFIEQNIIPDNNPAVIQY